MTNNARISVVIPCFRVTRHVLDVIARIPSDVERIYAVDDACPDGSGGYIETHCKDPRVVVLRNAVNLGVGGAVATGYRRALDDGMHIVVKIDGDGQMDPALLPQFVAPISAGQADYTKGNRFFSVDRVRQMPLVRLIGNAGLSFVNKMVSGYWGVMDPTTGYTAIHTAMLAHMPLDRLERRYFFESDMLYQLSLLRAVVRDVPIHARYADEVSGLSIANTLMRFPGKYATRFFKRFFYNYLLRDFNAGSIETLLGVLLISSGSIFGLLRWISSAQTGIPASAGTVMLAALPIILGAQLILSALQYDVENQPRQPIHPSLT